MLKRQKPTFWKLGKNKFYHPSIGRFQSKYSLEDLRKMKTPVRNKNQADHVNQMHQKWHDKKFGIAS